MPPQAHETLHNLCIILSVCFSFMIFLLSFWFKKADEKQRLMSFAFSSVLLLNLAAALLQDQNISAVLLQYTDAILLLLIFIALVTGRKVLVRSLTLLLPAVLIIAVKISPSFGMSAYHPNISSIILTAFSLVIMYKHKSERGTGSLLFWFIPPMLASGLIGLFGGSFYVGSAVLLLKLVSYSILLYFFYKSFVQILLDKLDKDEKMLSGIGRSVELEVKKRLLELENMNKKLLDISKIDALSNVLNKAAILKAIERLLIDKPKSELSILMFDIDDFKVINDTHGHIVGDKCIRMLSSSARSSFRDIDLIGRYGGDEFIIVLPDTSARQAIAIAQRFSKTIAETTSPRFTISIGISVYPADGADVRTLIQVADKNLYVSKKKGKNAVSYTEEQ